MSEKTDDIDLVIEDDAPAPAADLVVKPNGELETAPAKKPDIIDPDKGLEDLKANLARSEAGRLEAERRAHEAAGQVVAAKTEVHDSNLHLVKTAIETVKTSTDSLKGKLRDAMAAGDWDAAAEIQVDISNNSAKLAQLESGQKALESAPKPVQERYVPSDPVEKFASQLSPRSAAWVRSHPEYVTNPALNQKMMAAHNIAMADGVPVDTDDYFASIEDTLRFKRADPVQDDALSGANASSGRRAAPPAAPPSYSGTGNGQKPNTIRLSVAEREMAAISGLSDLEYAKQKLALQKEGRLN